MAGFKIVVGYDGSDQANAAIDDLQRAGLPETFEAVVLSVSDVWIPEETESTAQSGGGPESGAATESHAVRALRQTHHLAEQGRDRLQLLFPAAHVRAEARADNPAWALLEKVNEWNPDLVVVGADNRGVLGRMILGSVAHKVLSEAHCSVRIGRTMRSEPDAPVRVLAGLDGSRDARAAVRAISRRSWPEGSSVRLVAAHPPAGVRVFPLGSQQGDAGLSAAEDEAIRRVRQQLEDAGELLTSHGLATEAYLHYGTPVPMLVDAAAEWRADVVFLGARGHRVLERLLLGSVSSAIAARVPCSVEVIRPWKGNEDEEEE